MPSSQVPARSTARKNTLSKSSSVGASALSDSMMRGKHGTPAFGAWRPVSTASMYSTANVHRYEASSRGSVAESRSHTSTMPADESWPS